MTDKIVIFSTCATETDAANLARMLVEKRLAACVNVLPRVHSFYRWQGSMEESDEFLLIIKSSRARFEELRRELLAVHPYELPEAIAVPVVDGSPAYLQWIDQNLGSGAEE